jgi:hypothetical protein
MGSGQSLSKFKEIVDENNFVIGISTICAKKKYSIGDEVSIKDHYGKKKDLIITSIDGNKKRITFNDGGTISFDNISFQESGIRRNGVYTLGYTGKELEFFYNMCTYVEFRVGDIVEYKDNYDNIYILKILGIENKKIKLGDLDNNILDEIPYENLIEKKSIDTELKIPDMYRKNSIISFDEDDKHIIVKVIDFKPIIDPETNMIDQEKSFIYFIKNYNFKINLDQTNLKPEPKGTKLTNESEVNIIFKNKNYSFKYAKYKTKYLMYKNNLYNK